MLRIENQLISAKQVARSRERSAFTQEVLSLGLEKGGFAYVSHKEWLSSLGEKANTMAVGSLKNGPRYSLKPHGLDCKAITLSGEDLEKVAEAEGRELTETDIIYAIKASE